MAEIKSTLDLVMERTRHLSLSEDEKRAQQKADFEKRLQGLLQQYADKAITAKDLQDRTAALQAEMKLENREVLVEAVIRRIDPDKDNTHWFDLLGAIVPAILDSLMEALAAHRDRRADLLTSARRQMQNQLARRHQITGSAVKPNPRKDPTCQKDLAALGQDTQARIETIAKKAFQP